MFHKVMTKVFGTKHGRQIKKLQPLVNRINDLEASLKSLDDSALKAKTGEFRQRLSNGEALDDLLPESFATMREAALRVLKMRHYDVQMLGGIAMHRGMILEMRTGEGKTLTATTALYLNSLGGKGSHLITVNDYLASRDGEWMGEVFRFLGMEVGVIVHGLYHRERQRAYRADITYGTNNEFGFDYLRDNMKETIEKYVQRELNYAIVDEVDSILIDEARTPLIISGTASKPAETYIVVDKMIPSLRRELDYVLDEKATSVQLTEAGVDRVEKLLDCSNLYSAENSELLHHVQQALRGHTLYKKEVNYLVEDGEVLIVDEFTGRKMEGRRWSDGLHQAIEAKEGVRIQPESRTLATITYQNYFRMYDKLSGMTGTADTEAEEFHKIYDLECIVIPTNKPLIRKDRDDLVYKTASGKFKAVVDQIRDCYDRGQPVLVGTTSVEKSMLIHRMLERDNIPHNVLNAKQHQREANVVAQAGRKHAITVATNMAGRGTDIILGGNPDMMAQAHFDPDEEPEKYKELAVALKGQCDEERLEVLELGGLYIVGTERHESRRIDNQLRGRAGRQGDPGASLFFLSLEDDLMRIFGADRITNLMERLGMEEDVPIEAAMVNKAIANAQSKVEAMHFDTRKNLFEYDNVMNEQRKAIYALRKQILEGRYVPEVLDEEGKKSEEKLVPPPSESGPHTTASLMEEVRGRVETIVDGYCREKIEAEGGEVPDKRPYPEAGIVPHELTHEIYRHYGSLARLDDIKTDRTAVLERITENVASSLIQQRERLMDLAFKLVDDTVGELCPEDVHPDEWDIEGVEKAMLERFHVTLKIAEVEEDIEKLVDRCWEKVQGSLLGRERDYGLYTFLFYVRQIYLHEIDEQWIDHLKNIEHLRAGIGLIGYASKNPKNEYKIRGYTLFKDMWDSIEDTVLEQIIQMRLTQEQKNKAAEGAEHETSLTEASQRRERTSSRRRASGEVDKLQAAARRAVEKLQQGDEGRSVASSRALVEPRRPEFPKVGRNDPCPCGSGKRYKKCHGKAESKGE